MKKSNASRILDKLKIPFYIDESAFQFPFIIFSAGVRGLQLYASIFSSLKENMPGEFNRQ
ncbi:hypothetical protein KJ813_03390 [bacterium]|nr:hypothetical protein [bacterium]MBU4361692.1 hypothetical protein [bacterium]MBU4601984.1 hypothetical protein [bacterium]